MNLELTPEEMIKLTDGKTFNWDFVNKVKKAVLAKAEPLIRADERAKLRNSPELREEILDSIAKKCHSNLDWPCDCIPEYKKECWGEVATKIQKLIGEE